MSLKEELFILSHGFSSEWQECVEGEITPVVTARKQREQGREQDTSLQDGSPETSFLQMVLPIYAIIICGPMKGSIQS